jgi:steroid delta-isomerase-like uncharacterized protein
MATTTTTNADVVRASIDAINAHDTGALRELWAPEVVERFPDRTCYGPDELAAYFQGLFDAVPDLVMRIEAIAESGETVFLHWCATGRHSGASFQGINPTGKALEVHGMDQFTVRDGRIVANFVVFDQMDFGRQLGLMPADGSAGERVMKAAFNAKLAVRGRFARG